MNRTRLSLAVYVALCAGLHVGPAAACRDWDDAPNWLRLNPPVAAILLPNTDVITLGELGAAKRLKDLQQGQTAPEDAARWFRYSNHGRLLAELPAEVHWWVLYFADYEAISRSWRKRGAVAAEYRGYLIFEDAQGKRLALYDYDGTALPLGLDLESEQQRYVVLSFLEEPH